MSDVKDGLKYTKDHEWARVDGAKIDVGISRYAVEQLGDITLVNLDVKVGDKVKKGGGFGTIESVKTLSDLFSPVAGTITRINAELADKPENVNLDCYGAWMVTIQLDDPKELDELLNAADYTALLSTLG